MKFIIKKYFDSLKLIALAKSVTLESIHFLSIYLTQLLSVSQILN